MGFARHREAVMKPLTTVSFMFVFPFRHFGQTRRKRNPRIRKENPERRKISRVDGMRSR